MARFFKNISFSSSFDRIAHFEIKGKRLPNFSVFVMFPKFPILIDPYVIIGLFFTVILRFKTFSLFQFLAIIIIVFILQVIIGIIAFVYREEVSVLLLICKH